jgi:hypothetical protein
LPDASIVPHALLALAGVHPASVPETVHVTFGLLFGETVAVKG